MGLLDDAIREHLDLKRKRGSDPDEIQRLESEALGPVRREPRSMRATSQAASEGGARPVSGGSSYEELDRVDDEAEHGRRGFLGRRRREADPEPYDELEPPSSVRRLPSEPDDDLYYDEFEEAPPREAAGPSPAAAEPSFEPEPPALTFDSAPPVRPQFPELPGTVPSTPDDELFEEEEWADETEDPQVSELPTAGAAELPPARHQPAPQAPAAPREPQAWDDETQLFDVPGHFAREDSARQGEPGDEDVLDQTPEFLQDTPDHDRLWFEQKPPKDFDFDG